MPKISTYEQDPGLKGEDKLLGSSYEGENVYGPVYLTKSYKLSELADYFGGFIQTGSGSTIDIALLEQTVNENVTSIAEANQSLTVIANDLLAQATFKTNLASTFGTFDENGNLISLSQAFADQVLQTTASDRYANAQFATNLAASVGTYDENGNLITLSTAFADQVLQVTTSDKYATAEFTTKLASNFGTYDENGDLVELSSGFANQILSTTSEAGYATSEFTTNLASSIGTYNPDGTITALSSAFAQQAYDTAAKPDYAYASFVNNFGASLGSFNPDGTLVFDIDASYNQDFKTYIENNSAIAEAVETLTATYATLPVTIRQDDPPVILDPVTNELNYPLGSIWIDTNDANALYVLIEDPSDPIGYAWSPTTSEALGDLILSNSQLQTEVNILSTNLSTEATKLETLTSQFGVYDPATDTFEINNSANVISELRTYADSESAAASKVDGINSVLNMVDANGYVIKNLATFNQEITTYVDANSSIAQSVSDLNSTVGGLSTTVSVQQQSINGIEGKYGVTIDSNGNVAGFQLLNGTGGSAFNVSVDAFNIYSGTTNANVFSVDAGQVKLNVPLNGVSGTFTGVLQAGGVTIQDDNITLNVEGFGSQIKFTNNDGSALSTITQSSVTNNLIITGADDVSVNSPDSNLFLRSTSAWLVGPDIRLTATDATDGDIYITGNGTVNASGFDSFLFYAGANRLQGSSSAGISLVSGINTLTVDTTGVYVNGQVITGGGPTTDTNYYLQGVSINNTSGVLTFDVNGAANPTVSIATYVSNRLAGYMPSSGGTFTGSVSATDFILTNSDISLKENIGVYQPKPINIQYKEYNLKSNGEKRLGVIAQELETDHPEFVKEDGNGIKSVSYIEMLIAKVAELEARIKELENGAA